MDGKMNESYFDVGPEIKQLKQKGYSYHEAYDLLQELVAQETSKIKEKKIEWRSLLIGSLKKMLVTKFIERGCLIDQLEKEWEFLGTFTIRQLLDLNK